MANDDVALIQFGFRLMRLVLHGELSIPGVEGTCKKHLQEREELLKMSKEIEILEFGKNNEEELAAAVLGEADEGAENQP